MVAVEDSMVVVAEVVVAEGSVDSITMNRPSGGRRVVRAVR